MLNKSLPPCRIKDRLYEMIKHVIIGDRYMIKGSFKRDMVVVDVDVENDIRKVNDVRSLIIKMIEDLPHDMRFIDMTSIDTNDKLLQPWRINSVSDIVYNHNDAIRYTDSLLHNKIINKSEHINLMNLLSNDIDVKNLSKYDEFIYFKRKVRWSVDSIRDGYMSHNGRIFNFDDVIKNDGNVMHIIYLTNMIFIPYDIAFRTSADKVRLYNSLKHNKYIWNEYYYIATSRRDLTNDDRSRLVSMKIKFVGYRQIIMMLFYYDRIKRVLSEKELSMVRRGITNRIRYLPSIDNETIMLMGDSIELNDDNHKDVEVSLNRRLHELFKSFTH